MRSLFVAVLVALFATSAYAESVVVTGKLIEINPIYTKVYQNVPQKVCYDVEVPVYGTVQKGGGDAAGGALAGMIIGGLIGKGVTGKDNGAAAGAVIGGIIGADKGANGSTKRVITGYRTERQCSEESQRQVVTVANEYDLVYRVNGHRYTMRVNSAQGQRAWIGQTKRFRVSYQPLN